MNWQLEYNTVKKPLAEWGFSNLLRKCVNQAADKVTFQAAGQAIDDLTVLSPGSLVKLYFKDKPWFVGYVTRTPGYAQGNREFQEYELSGPWWFLENLVYQQGWAQVKHVDQENQLVDWIDSGRIILGQDKSGSALSNGAQIKQILDYAIAQGAPLQVGDIDVDMNFPMDETKDLSCAEAVKRLMRWSPDAVVFFDYSTGPVPTIHVKKRSKMNSCDLEFQSLSAIEINPRHDLQLNGVVIKYEKTHAFNGKSWSTLDIDAYPKTVRINELKTLVMTVELEGARGQSVTQEVETKRIRENDVDWWMTHIPALKNVPKHLIRLNSVTRKGILPNELISGSVSIWMDRDAEEDIITAEISYETEKEVIVGQEVAVKLIATDAVSNTYVKRFSSTAAEETPKGLAKGLYEAVKDLQFEGSVRIVGEEVAYEKSNYGVGQVLNIVGGNKDWATMRAMVQSVKEDVDGGRVTVEFGPAKQLGVVDLVELLRINRHRNLPKNAKRRTTGEAGSDSEVVLGKHSRVDNTVMGPARWGRMEFQDQEKENCKIILDTKELSKDTVIALREEYVCEDGELKKRMTLCSAPYGEGVSGE